MLVRKKRMRRAVITARRGDREKELDRGIVEGLLPGVPFVTGDREHRFGIRAHLDREAERIESDLKWGR
jgi:hypothetical protein